MKSTSTGVAQRLAKEIQAERCKPNMVWVEPNNEKRQDIVRHARRTNGVVRISKLARHYHGNKF